MRLPHKQQGMVVRRDAGVGANPPPPSVRLFSSAPTNISKLEDSTKLLLEDSTKLLEDSTKLEDDIVTVRK
jgi:hypothetical protein